MFRIEVAFALIVLAASIATAKVMAQNTKVVAQNTSNHSIGTHQIDRFEAIRMLQESLQSNPNDAAAWIVLGHSPTKWPRISPLRMTNGITSCGRRRTRRHWPCSRKTPG